MVKESRYLEGTYNVRWALGGRKVVFCKPDAGVWVSDTENEAPGPDATSLGQDTWFEALSPDGRTAYLSSPQQGVVAVDLASLERRSVTGTPFGRWAVSPNGNQAAVRPLQYNEQTNSWSAKGDLLLLDLNSGDRRDLPVHPDVSMGWWGPMLEWSHDGRWALLKWGKYPDAERYLVTDGIDRHPLSASLSALQWSVGSDLIGLQSLATIKRLVQVSASTAEVKQYSSPAGFKSWTAVRPGPDGNVRTFSFSPGRRWLTRQADDDGTVVLTDLATGEERLVPGPRTPYDITWLDDDAVFMLSDGSIRSVTRPDVSTATDLPTPAPNTRYLRYQGSFSPGNGLIPFLCASDLPSSGNAPRRLTGVKLWLLSPSRVQAKEVADLDQVRYHQLMLRWAPSGSALVVDERNQGSRFLWLGEE